MVPAWAGTRRGANIRDVPVNEIRIDRVARGRYRLTAEIALPRPRADVFGFFAEPRNLERITPAWLGFGIRTAGAIPMGRGARIRYGLRLHGVPIGWESEITAYDPPRRFVDEQVRGPYRRWVHEHRFEDVEGGCLVVDRVDYAPRGGAVAQALLVRRDLLAIFRHRHAVLADLLGRAGQPAHLPTTAR